jgi:hypothetical protein
MCRLWGGTFIFYRDRAICQRPRTTPWLNLGNVPTNWTVYGTSDLNGDGMGDILWQDNVSGTIAVWFMNGSQIASAATLSVVPGSSGWSIIGTHKSVIVWRKSSGELAAWNVQGSQIAEACDFGVVPTNWSIAGVLDLTSGVSLLWRDSVTGTVAIWVLGPQRSVSSAVSLGAVPAAWTIAQIGDYNGDGVSDVLWRDNNGNTVVWFLSGTGTLSSAAPVGTVPVSWSVQNTNAN